MLCKLVTEKGVMGLPLFNFRGNTLQEWVTFAHTDLPGIVSEKPDWYLLRRLNSVPRCLLEIELTPSHRHPIQISALEPIMVITIPRVEEAFKSVLDEMTNGTDFKLAKLSHAENTNLTQNVLNISIDELENGWNIHPDLLHTFTSKAKLSSNGQLSYC
jgi:hypothetical protein